MRRRSVLWLALLSALLPSLAAAQGFSGAGSTFAQPILQRWGQAFTQLQGDGGALLPAEGGLDYEPVGSTGGVMRVLQRAVDFGATDVPMGPEELDRHNLIQFPFVTGGVAIAVNLRGVAPGALRLPGEVLARLFMGEITRWSDPAIAAANPGLSLPDAPVRVVRRADGSGTTYHLAAYLAGVSPAWRDRLGVDTILNWPVGTGARGNRAVAEAVRATEGAIGYAEASQAAALGLSVALIENAAGRFVAPTPAALQAAAATAAWDPARHFHAPVAAPRDEAAYPITATVFALMPRRPPSAARARQVQEFFRLALTERAADAAALGYVPLPDALVRQVAAYWRDPPRPR